MSSRIQQLQNEIATWSDNTFGANRPAEIPLYHLAKEIRELIASPDDSMEYADCMLLLLDAYRMAGGTADELVELCYKKLEINRKREWGLPDKNGVIEHIREE